MSVLRSTVRLFAQRRNTAISVEAAFDSTHSRMIDLIAANSRIPGLGCGSRTVGAALKDKGCHVVGCNKESDPRAAAALDQFVTVDLDRGMPAAAAEDFDFVLLPDVVEQLKSPEDFLDQLRHLAARQRNRRIILTTANIAFIAMRIALLFGGLEYGKRGLLDLTHTRLFTRATLGMALESAGFEIETVEEIVVPFGLALGTRFWLGC